MQATLTLLPTAALPARLRVLAPLKREGDICKVLPYLVALADKAAIRVLFLHVAPPRCALAQATAQALLGAAASASLLHGLEHETVLADGDVAFAILDSAEALACDQIVVARAGGGGWRHLFATPVVRQLEELGRGIPLVLVNFVGVAQEAVR
jgi:K+-sensing histidine kinase KdpD